MFRIHGSPFFVPAGTYLGRYQGIRKLPKVNRKGRNGLPLPAGIAHKWEIIDGPYKGKVAERVVTEDVTEDNTHGQVLKGLAPGSDFESVDDIDATDFVGELYRLEVEEYEKDNDSKEVGCRVNGIEPAEKKDYPQELYPASLFSVPGEEEEPAPRAKAKAGKKAKPKAYYVKVNGKRTGPFDEAGVQRTIVTCLKRGDVIGGVSPE